MAGIRRAGAPAPARAAEHQGNQRPPARRGEIEELIEGEARCRHRGDEQGEPETGLGRQREHATAGTRGTVFSVLACGSRAQLGTHETAGAVRTPTIASAKSPAWFSDTSSRRASRSATVRTS